jgi:DNA-binding GntR family transcriptional regulator
MSSIERGPDRTCRALETAILSGRLKPRQRLIETELAAELHASRFLVRRAITELARKGLVEVVPQKGARVVDISDQEVEDTYRVRLTLELLAAELMAQRVSRERLAAIKRVQREYAAAVQRRAFEEMILKNETFHRALYAATENRLLCELLEKVRNVTFPLRYAAYFIPGRAQQSLRDHEAMIGALEAGDLPRLMKVVQRSVSFPKEIYLSRRDRASGSPEGAGEDRRALRGRVRSRR